jgi:hypothetical protein
LFLYTNVLVLPAWALLVVAPRWKWTRVIAAYIVPILLSLVWIGLMAMHYAPANGGFATLDQLATLVADPWLLTAGWIHAVMLDVFVAAWAVRDAQRLGIAHAFVVPCIILMFLAGPLGLLVYFGVRVAIVRRLPWRN